MISTKTLFFRLLAPVLILATILAWFPANLTVEAAWDTDQIIDNTDLNTQQPNIAVDGQNAVAVWLQYEGDDYGGRDIYRVYSNYSTDGGSTWHQPQLIENNIQCAAYEYKPPSIAISGLNVVVVWQQLNTPGGYDSIFSNYSTDGGQTWQQLSELDTNLENDAYNPEVALDGDHAVAIWHQYWEDPVGHSRYPRFFTSTFNFTSPGWNTPVLIEDNNLIQYWNYYDSRIAISGSTVVAVWQQMGSGDHKNLYTNYSIDYGVSWNTGNARTIENLDGDAVEPDLAISEDYAVAVWTQNSHIYYNYFNLYLNTWSLDSAKMVNSSTAFAAFPVVAVSGENAACLWMQEDNGRFRTFCNAGNGISLNYDVAYVKPVDDVNETGDCLSPDVAFSGTNLYAVWSVKYNETDYRIYGNTSIDNGMTWNADPLIEDNSGQIGEYPRIAASPLQSIAVWQQGPEIEEDLIYSIYTNTGVPPILPAEQMWSEQVDGAVTDLATGNVIDDNRSDVASLDDHFAWGTLHLFNGSGDGSDNWDQPAAGYSTAVEDIDGDNLNEVVSAGNLLIQFDFHPMGDGPQPVKGIFAFDNNGTLKWYHEAPEDITDIELGDINHDGIKDVIACGFIVDQAGLTGKIYALDGETGEDIDFIDGNETQWPLSLPHEKLLDVAVGELDGNPGIDVAAIGEGILGSLFALDNLGENLWAHSLPINGRTVEIGNVDTQIGNEIVAGTDNGWVGVFNPDNWISTKYSFFCGRPVTDIELGDLDENPSNGVEIACIDSGDKTLYALDIDNIIDAPDSQVIWTYPISWGTSDYGESLAIGDVDHDYQNEVIACNSAGSDSVYAFDGKDKNQDGLGDLVFTPFEIPDVFEITDLEIGDLDADGDQDIVFGTYDEIGGRVFAIKVKDSRTMSDTSTGQVIFDSDPSNLNFLKPVAENTLPTEGKPDYTYPHGFFSFTITGFDPGETVLVTVTLPTDAPVGTRWVKFENNSWSIIDIGDDDGDKIITFELTDTDNDGIITDPGAPAYPRDTPDRVYGVGGEFSLINKLAVAAPLAALFLILAITGLVLFRRKTF